MTHAPEAPIDPSHLAELDAMFGREVTDTLVAPMLAELGGAPSVIRDLLSAGDVAAARSAAHGLRGAALGLGCVGVATVCAQLENDDAGAMPVLAASLDAIAAQTADALRAARAT